MNLKFTLPVKIIRVKSIQSQINNTKNKQFEN